VPRWRRGISAGTLGAVPPRIPTEGVLTWPAATLEEREREREREREKEDPTQYIWRTLIAAVVYVVAVLLILPALLNLIGMPMSGALEAIIKGAAILIALGYILWGPPVVPG
jgi:hypothetical protein